MNHTEIKEIAELLTGGNGNTKVTINQTSISIVHKVFLTIAGLVMFGLVLWSQIVIQGLTIMAIAWLCGFVVGKEFREYTIDITTDD